jgi:DNA-binding MarR family transcriptional regulator
MASGTISDLPDHLGFWLRHASNHVSHAFARRMEGRVVTVAEWVALRTLYRQPPMPPSRLAELMGMTRGAISKLSDRLIGKGLVHRLDSADDHRSHQLGLTPEGEALVPQLAAEADANDAEFFGHLSDGEREALETALRALIARWRPRSLPVD